MVQIVVPYRALAPKSRLGLGPEIAAAMLDDVVAAAEAVGPTLVAAGDGGQGVAVAAELDSIPSGQVLIANADLPCARPRDLLALLGATPLGGMALVEAADGTTNALALADPSQFQDLYGAGSADRFRAYARSHGLACVTIAIPNLAADVDTLDDLHRLRGRLGRHTRAALASLKEAATA
jgi:2-phospho-L-lactate guanylyltransferase (CobY/MobA/RfbA family)